MKFRSRFSFTLIEMIVVLAIMMVAVAVVVGTFRGEDPAVVLDNAALEFESYLAQVRYRAAETGRDFVVSYPHEGTFLVASPDYSKSELAKIELDNETAIEELKFTIPSNCTLVTESGAEKLIAQDGKLEVMRFFPDGGAGAAHRLVMKCGEVCRSFDLSFLNGKLLVTNEDFTETYVDPGEEEEVVTEDEAETVI